MLANTSRRQSRRYQATAHDLQGVVIAGQARITVFGPLVHQFVLDEVAQRPVGDREVVLVGAEQPAGGQPVGHARQHLLAVHPVEGGGAGDQVEAALRREGFRRRHAEKSGSPEVVLAGLGDQRLAQVAAFHVAEPGLQADGRDAVAAADVQRRFACRGAFGEVR